LNEICNLNTGFVNQLGWNENSKRIIKAETKC